MATAATAVTTSGSDVSKIWRIVQGELAQGIQFENDEWEMVDDFVPPEDLPFSARSVTIPIDIIEGAGVASIPEGGVEARELSPNAREITVTMQQFNKRFNASRLAMYADKSEAQVEKQLKFQGAHAIRDLSRHFSDYFYGTSNAYLAQATATQTATTMTISLMGGYGVSGITDSAFITSKFKVSDWVAGINTGALVTNAIGQVTAVSVANTTITVVWNGSVTLTSADYIVKANSKGNTSLAHTDYSRGLVGMVDITTTASVHSLSSSTDANWDVAYSDTTSTRFNGTKITRAEDEIANEGGGKVTHVLIDQGVRRDWINYERAALRFSDPMNMETDGSIKSKGRKILPSKRVPPGYVYTFDKSALSKWTLLPKPDGKFNWGDGKEYIDENAVVFRIDMPVALITRNRKKFAYFTGQTRA
jgi:hypothetical protein